MRPYTTTEEIKVTKKMKRFFWAKYYETSGAFGRKKNGEWRNDKRTVQLSTEAEFWKYMALMKEGKSIKIPRRRFLGVSPKWKRPSETSWRRTSPNTLMWNLKSSENEKRTL